jgi:hypothetical protein
MAKKYLIISSCFLRTKLFVQPEFKAQSKETGQTEESFPNGLDKAQISRNHFLIETLNTTQYICTHNMWRIKMPNVTISLDKELLEKGRDYAQKNGTSLNKLIRELLLKTISGKNDEKMKSMFDLMDELNFNSEGKNWTREEIYER